VIKVSIITAVYNNREHLEECFSSVFSQTFQNIEFIVVDGGSTDGSVEIIQQNGQKIARWVSEPDKGIYDALNKGIGMASGDVIGFLHSDDLFYSSETIAHVAKAFETTGCEAVFGDLMYVSRDNPDRIIRYWKSNPFKASLLKQGWMPPHPTLFAKRQWYATKGTFRTDFCISADYDLILRLFSDKKFTTEYLPEVITKMRAGGASNRSLGNIYQKSKEDYIALLQSGVGGAWTLFMKNVRKVWQFVRKN
jgi:glycosyltransferase